MNATLRMTHAREPGGCAGSLPAVMNAVVDVLSPVGIMHIDMPATRRRRGRQSPRTKREN